MRMADLLYNGSTENAIVAICHGGQTTRSGRPLLFRGTRVTDVRSIHTSR